MCAKQVLTALRTGVVESSNGFGVEGVGFREVQGFGGLGASVSF